MFRLPGCNRALTPDVHRVSEGMFWRRGPIEPYWNARHMPLDILLNDPVRDDIAERMLVTVGFGSSHVVNPAEEARDSFFGTIRVAVAHRSQ